LETLTENIKFFYQKCVIKKRNFSIFSKRKISSMKRLLALYKGLVKELIPQIGLRASFLSSWKRLVVNMSAVQGGIIC